MKYFIEYPAPVGRVYFANQSDWLAELKSAVESGAFARRFDLDTPREYRVGIVEE